MVQKSAALYHGHLQLVLHLLITAQPFQNETDGIDTGGTHHIGAVLTVQDRGLFQTQDLSENTGGEGDPPVVHDDVLVMEFQQIVQRPVLQHGAACHIVLHQESAQLCLMGIQLPVVKEGFVQNR